ncbi:nucleotidyltransferase domain-containing protein [Peribacillus frigoritolerans]|uniref:nucleotidyltransferase domain-containing protein n=1 Tax=Peribacillus frigoritolerans TaxID=450367 RepID=UPI00380ABAC2
MDKNYSLDLDFINRELSLILEILKTENEDSLLLNRKELFIDIDWGQFLQLAMHHRLYPLIYSKLKKINRDLIPSHVIETLYREYKKNTFKMLLLSSEMEQVSKLFIENQIRLLFLKGPVIAADLFGDISLRTSKDLDILIPISNLERAEELLLNAGYEREEGETVLNIRKWRDHHVSYFHPEKKIQLELHWRLQPYPSKEPRFNELWERKRISMLTNYPVYFLGKNDLFLYLVSHGARHVWLRLRWLVDIDMILKQCIKDEKKWTLTKKYQNHYIVGQALILTSQLLNTPIEEELKKLTVGKRSKKLAQMAIFYINEEFTNSNNSIPTVSLNKNQISNIHLINNIKKSIFVNYYFYSLQTSSQNAFFIFRLFYPSSADLKTLILPKPLHFLYFPLRPFLWAWRMTLKR